jgi:hypothetical protein
LPPAFVSGGGFRAAAFSSLPPVPAARNLPGIFFPMNAALDDFSPRDTATNIRRTGAAGGVGGGTAPMTARAVVRTHHFPWMGVGRRASGVGRRASIIPGCQA